MQHGAVSTRRTHRRCDTRRGDWLHPGSSLVAGQVTAPCQSTQLVQHGARHLPPGATLQCQQAHTSLLHSSQPGLWVVDDSHAIPVPLTPLAATVLPPPAHVRSSPEPLPPAPMALSAQLPAQHTRRHQHEQQLEELPQQQQQQQGQNHQSGTQRTAYQHHVAVRPLADAVQTSIASLKACNSLTSLTHISQVLAQQYPHAVQQPGVVLALAAQLQHCLRVHLQHASGNHAGQQYEDSDSLGDSPQPNESSANQPTYVLNSADRVVVRTIAQQLCQWVQQSCSCGQQRQQQQQHQSSINNKRKQAGAPRHHDTSHADSHAGPYKPHQAVCILHALARCVRAAGGSCVLPNTLAFLVEPLLQSQCSSTSCTAAAAAAAPMKSSSAAAAGHRRQPQGRHHKGKATVKPLMPAQLVTAAWSLAVVGAHQLQRDCPQQLHGLGTWLFHATEPVLADMTQMQLSRLMWSLASFSGGTTPTHDKAGTGSRTGATVVAGLQQTAATVQPTNNHDHSHVHAPPTPAAAAVAAAAAGKPTAHIQRPPISWWLAFEAATLALVARPLQIPQDSTQAQGGPYHGRTAMLPKRPYLASFPVSQLSLLCWSVSHLAGKHVVAGTNSQVPFEQQPVLLTAQQQQQQPQGHGEHIQQQQQTHVHSKQVQQQRQEEGQQGVTRESAQQQVQQFPSAVWVQTLLGAVWAQRHMSRIAPESAAQIVQGLNRLRYRPPEFLLSHLITRTAHGSTPARRQFPGSHGHGHTHGSLVLKPVVPSVAVPAQHTTRNGANLQVTARGHSHTLSAIHVQHTPHALQVLKAAGVLDDCVATPNQHHHHHYNGLNGHTQTNSKDRARSHAPLLQLEQSGTAQVRSQNGASFPAASTAQLPRQQHQLVDRNSGLQAAYTGAQQRTALLSPQPVRLSPTSVIQEDHNVNELSHSSSLLPTAPHALTAQGHQHASNGGSYSVELSSPPVRAAQQASQQQQQPDYAAHPPLAAGLPLPQLMSVLYNACKLQTQLPPHTLDTLCAAFQVSLDRCSPAQLVYGAAWLYRLGVKHPSSSLVLVWLAELHARFDKLPPRATLQLLQVLHNWRLWPGQSWMCDLLNSTQPSVPTYTAQQLRQLLKRLHMLGVKLQCSADQPCSQTMQACSLHQAPAGSSAGAVVVQGSTAAAGCTCMFSQAPSQQTTQAGTASCMGSTMLNERVLVAGPWLSCLQSSLQQAFSREVKNRSGLQQEAVKQAHKEQQHTFKLLCSLCLPQAVPTSQTCSMRVRTAVPAAAPSPRKKKAGARNRAPQKQMLNGHHLQSHGKESRSPQGEDGAVAQSSVSLAPAKSQRESKVHSGDSQAADTASMVVAALAA